MTKNKLQTTHNNQKHPRSASNKQPFIEHLYELRKRVFYIAISIAIWSGAAYAVEHRVIDMLLKPAHGQSFIYTSPIGGMNFLFKVCIDLGIAASIPIIVYQFLRYIEPLMSKTSSRFIQLGSLASGVLAAVGIAFGYFLGLPTALNFLLHQFMNAQIKPLITIEAYLSFVTVYMLGAALMFQIPLIILFINRIKPLTPQQLVKKERWVILIAFVLAFVMNPTPNVIDQLFIAAPIIVTYQLAIGIIWWQCRVPRKVSRIYALRVADERARAARQQRLNELKQVWQAADTIATNTDAHGLISQAACENIATTSSNAILNTRMLSATPAKAEKPLIKRHNITPNPVRPRQYVDGIRPGRLPAV